MKDHLSIAALAVRGATYDGEKGCVVRSAAKSAFSSEVWDRLVSDDSVLNLTAPAPENAGDHVLNISREMTAYAEANGTFPAAVLTPEGVLALGTSYDAAEAKLSAIAEGSELSGEGGVPFIPAARRSRAPRTDTLRGKISAVTGGAQGFGEALVREIVAGGSFCFIIDLNEDGAQELATSLNSEFGATVAHAVAGNVADEASVEALVQRMVRETGGLDLFISNAGVVRAGSVKEMSSKDFSFTTNVNYLGYFHCVKYVSQALSLQNMPTGEYFTDIVQINSKSGLQGSNKNGAYAGGKFGGIGLTQSFALELVEDNIKVNSICPGNFFDGPLWSDPEKGLFVQYLRAGKVSGAKNVADVQAFYEAKVPMGRGCTGRDVMLAVYYIVEQRYETGQAVPVTGGQVMLK